MSLAEETRRAVRERPWLFDALRAGVVNYAAAARVVGLDAETEAVATALRRFENALDVLNADGCDVRVRMHRLPPDNDDAPIVNAGEDVASGGEDCTVVVASGGVDARALEHVLGVLRTHEIDIEAAAVSGDSLRVIVPRHQGGKAVRHVESALESLPV